MEIAVIGIACRYPGANSAREFFENILAGRRYFREIPPERWQLADYYDLERSRPDRTYCKTAAVLEGFEFNPSAFRIPQSTYRATDLAQWLALTVAKEALDDAQISTPPRSSTAVILGNTLAGETSRAHLVRYRWPYARRVFMELLDCLGIAGAGRQHILERIEERYKKPFPPVNEDNLAGGLANTIAGRICNYFDFKGGGYTVDGACSSSLLSIQEASIGLEQRLCDLALAGGVDMSLDPFELVGFAKVGALTDSDIRVYDQRANGFLPGEGCGIVVLKRLKEAVADGNRVYSVIRGVGYSSDGRGGITAPSVAGQSLAVDRAYSMAGYSFADVELIEGHGTGTPVGDRTELETFIDAKRRHGAAPAHRCGIGSVKSVIGHTKAAAGVAGFIKATLSVYHHVLPPTMGLAMPNELFNATTHLYPLLRGVRRRGEGPMRAAVSSAGFGGINTHITVESFGASASAARQAIDLGYLMQSQQNAELFLLAADDVADLREQVTALAAVGKRLCHAELGDLAAHCARGASSKPLRLAVVADSAAGLHEKLQRVAGELATRFSAAGEIDWSDLTAGIFMRRAKRVPRVAFLFPGQGAQYPDMSRRLCERYAFAASHWHACDEALERALPGRLSDFVFTGETALDTQALRERSAKLRETIVAQPAIVAASMAATEVLRYLGVEPDVVIGHSLGEYTALWCAGALQKSDMLRLVAARGAAMGAVGPDAGSMLSISAGAAKVGELLAEVGGALTIANHNAPTQVVVSGEKPRLDALAELCAVLEIPTTRLEVSGPFHSPLMRQAQARLTPELTRQHWQPLDRLLISATTGKLLEAAAEAPEVLSRQITAPVLFTQAIETALGEHVDVFIDVGPAPALCGLTRRIAGERPAVILGSDLGVAGDWTGWLQTVGYAYAAGLPVIPARLFENRFVRPLRWPYEPKFIVSPCELAVEPLALAPASLGLTRASPMPVLPVAASTAAAAPAVEVDPKSPQSVLEFMRRLIMDRFGYPAELIAPGARLLEDLNLDSIKSAEVIGEAMARVEVHADPSQFMKLTLGEMAARLAARTQEDAPTARAAQADAEQLPAWVRTFTARISEEPLPEQRRELPVGRVIVAATAEDRIAAGLLEHLQARGMTAELWRQGQALRAEDDIIGCIALLPRPARDGSAAADPLGALDANLFALPDFLLDVAQVLAPQFTPARGTPRFFATVIRSGMLLGHGAVAGHWDASPAAAAFIKSWFLEHPSSQARVIDMDPGAMPATIAERLLDEITTGDGYVEAAYTRGGRRHVIDYVPTATALMSPSTGAPSAGEVLAAIGGAKGITAECIKALAHRAPCTVALLGSSPAPAASGSGSDAAQIVRTLEALEAQGVTAKYYQCDVTDAAAVRTCVAQISKELGPIRALMHAAGINVPHRIDGLARPAFHAVLKPKMLGLVHLLKAVDLAGLRQLTVFSSVIGVSGMAGNADYAFANAWMGLVLKWLAALQPHLQCRVFAFSVWDEVGMGARLGSVESLRRLGIGAIPREQGVRHFVDLMERCWRTPELVISARVAGLATLRFADRPVSHALPFARHVVVSHPGIELVCETVLDPASDRYVLDHNYNGALLFPAVVGIEAMAQVALRCVRVLLHEARAPALENIRFMRPIVVPAEGRRIRIYASADEPLQDGTLRVRAQIRSSLDGYASEAFSAECVWRAAEPARKALPSCAWPQALPVDPQAELYGSLFFQGPMFQHVTALHDVSSTHCVAQVRIPAVEHRDPAEPGPVLGPASVRDCFLHAIQVCVPEYRILPVAIESIETFGLSGTTAYIVASERLRTAEEFVYDIDVVSEDGGLLEQLRGYRCRIIGHFDDQQTLDRIARVHAYALDRQAPRVAAARH